MATWVVRGTTLAKSINGVSGWTVRLSLPTETFWKYAPVHVCACVDFAGALNARPGLWVLEGCSAISQVENAGDETRNQETDVRTVGQVVICKVDDVVGHLPESLSCELREPERYPRQTLSVFWRFSGIDTSNLCLSL